VETVLMLVAPATLPVVVVERAEGAQMPLPLTRLGFLFPVALERVVPVSSRRFLVHLSPLVAVVVAVFIQILLQ
jgi:hypothetical protein